MASHAWRAGKGGRIWNTQAAYRRKVVLSDPARPLNENDRS